MIEGLTVAHLVGSTGRSGVESHLRALFHGLRSEGIRPVLVCPDRGLLTEALERTGFVVRLAAPRRRAGFRELTRTRKAVEDADLIHSHGPRSLWWSAVMKWMRDPRPFVGTIHEIGRRGAGSWRGPWFARLERLSLRAQDALITVSRDQRRRLIEMGAAPASKLHAVHGSAAILLEARRTRAAADVPAFAVTAARLEREKGLDILLDAWALLATRGSGLRLDIWGNGSQRPMLERRATALGIAGSVRFCGWCPDPARQMERAVLYVAPSRDEPFGISVLEAMALGLPVVATAVGGHLDLLGEANPDLLVPPEDPVALASAIDALFRMSDHRRSAVGSELSVRASREFSPERMGRETRVVYESVLRSA